MRRGIVLASAAIIAVMMIHSASALPTTGSTIFFDDFVASQFPQNWTPTNGFTGLGNVTQIGGYLIMTITRTSALSLDSSNVINIAATIPPPIVTNTTRDGAFFQFVWKMQPFNMTNSPNSVVRHATLEFGLQDSFNWNRAIMFDLWQFDNICTSLCDVGVQTDKSNVHINILNPVGSGNRFCSLEAFNGLPPATCANGGIRYTGQGSVAGLDLNAQHIFTMQMKIALTTHTSWVAFRVDNNAVMNVTQQACGCLDNPGVFNQPTLFPFFQIGYCATGTAGQKCASVAGPPNQSLATAIDYIFVTDYATSSLPPGQILSPCAAFRNCTVPPQLPQPGVTGSLSDFLVFEANSIAPGNVYAGGMILMGIMASLIFVGMGLAARKAGTSFASFGFLYTISVLGISFFGFITGILPFWVPVMTTIITIAITFGVIRAGPSSGGVVPD